MKFFFTKQFNRFDSAIIVLAATVAANGHLLVGLAFVFGGALVSAAGEIATERGEQP